MSDMGVQRNLPLNLQTIVNNSAPTEKLKLGDSGYKIGYGSVVGEIKYMKMSEQDKTTENTKVRDRVLNDIMSASTKTVADKLWPSLKPDDVKLQPSMKETVWQIAKSNVSGMKDKLTSILFDGDDKHVKRLDIGTIESALAFAEKQVGDIISTMK